MQFQKATDGLCRSRKNRSLVHRYVKSNVLALCYYLISKEKHNEIRKADSEIRTLSVIEKVFRQPF